MLRHALMEITNINTDRTTSAIQAIIKGTDR